MIISTDRIKLNYFKVGYKLQRLHSYNCIVYNRNVLKVKEPTPLSLPHLPFKINSLLLLQVSNKILLSLFAVLSFELRFLSMLIDSTLQRYY